MILLIPDDSPQHCITLDKMAFFLCQIFLHETTLMETTLGSLTWTPDYLTLSRDARRMLCADVEAERDAIAQYEAHIRKIKDECVDG